MDRWIAWLNKHKPWTWLFSGIGVSIAGWVLSVLISETRPVPETSPTEQGGITSRGNVSIATEGGIVAGVNVTQHYYGNISGSSGDVARVSATEEARRKPFPPSKNGTNDPTENDSRNDTDRDDHSSAAHSIEPFKQYGHKAQSVCAGQLRMSLVPYYDPSARPARPEEFTHVIMRINGESDAKRVPLSETVPLSDNCRLSGIGIITYGPGQFGVQAQVETEEKE